MSDLPTGTEVNYYFVCKRKLWLFTHQIELEHDSDRVASGRLLHETSYRDRAEKDREFAHGPIKIDYFNRNTKTVHEVKLSNSIEKAHYYQLCYYLYYLEKVGYNGLTGILEYPKLKKREEITLTDEERRVIETVIEEVEQIKTTGEVPGLLDNKKICRKCAYYEFCYAGEAV